MDLSDNLLQKLLFTFAIFSRAFRPFLSLHGFVHDFVCTWTKPFWQLEAILAVSATTRENSLTYARCHFKGRQGPRYFCS